ncbi:hypothetical protein KJ641_03855 [Patescibacteria group bacterium]|nr:hypothetical protein [Patescibacteria group bacterium]MBU1895975.1 hypothetical protein [Patescibacteria group bacterium]
MPIIRVLNWPSEMQKADWRQIREEDDIVKFFRYAYIKDQRYLKNLGNRLKKACIDTQIPRVDSERLISVSFDIGSLLPDTTLVILVEGLFDTPDRTKEIRDKLAKFLTEAVKPFIPNEWEVEVLVKRFDPEKDSYIKV